MAIVWYVCLYVFICIYPLGIHDRQIKKMTFLDDSLNQQQDNKNSQLGMWFLVLMQGLQISQQEAKLFILCLLLGLTRLSTDEWKLCAMFLPIAKYMRHYH